MKALVIGATGATGKDLVDVLLNDDAYQQVVVFVRKTMDISHQKLVELVVDFDQIDTFAEHIRGDVWFSCLGTTLKAAGSKDKQWQIDYEIPAQFASLAKRNGVTVAVLLSAYGASPNSSLFYSKLKGKLETHIDSLLFNSYIIFRPGLLLRKNTDRIAERLSASMLRLLNGIGLFQKFRPMPTRLLAEKMAKAPQIFQTGKHVVELDQIFNF